MNIYQIKIFQTPSIQALHESGTLPSAMADGKGMPGGRQRPLPSASRRQQVRLNRLRQRALCRLLADGKDEIILKMPSLCRLPNAIFAVSLVKSRTAKNIVNIKKRSVSSLSGVLRLACPVPGEQYSNNTNRQGTNDDDKHYSTINTCSKNRRMNFTIHYPQTLQYT